jgi:hypothetical protein
MPPNEAIPQGRGTNQIDRGSNLTHHEGCKYGKKKGMVHKDIL